MAPNQEHAKTMFKALQARSCVMMTQGPSCIRRAACCAATQRQHQRGGVFSPCWSIAGTARLALLLLTPVAGDAMADTPWVFGSLRDTPDALSVRGEQWRRRNALSGSAPRKKLEKVRILLFASMKSVFCSIYLYEVDLQCNLISFDLAMGYWKFTDSSGYKVNDSLNLCTIFAMLELLSSITQLNLVLWMMGIFCGWQRAWLTSIRRLRISMNDTCNQ